MNQETLFGRVNKVVQGDAIQMLSELPADFADLLITDPPYQSLDKHRAIGTTTRLQGGWFPTVPNEYYLPFLFHMYRILKPNSHAYIFCDDETSDIIIADFAKTPFRYWKRIVWDKLRMGTGYHYRNRHEFILFFEKGKRKLNDLSIPSVLQYKRVQRKHDHPDFYPTEKPVDLCELLVRQSSEPDAMVIDPFVGSGSSLVAARNLGRQYWGCDIEQRAVDLTRKRLTEPVMAQ